MVAPRILCDADLLQRLVRGLVSRVEIDELELHLGECTDCQQALQTLSGGGDFAASARNMLPPREWQVRADLAKTNLQELPFLTPSEDSRYIGKLGSYEIESVLGQGGFGVVLKGWDSSLNRFVAIKVLASPLLHSAAAKQRFAREARAAASVTHEAVVPIYAVESGGPIPYLVLAYVPGPSLDKYLEEHGTLEPLRVVRIAMQIAQGLAAAHAQGIVHRDIKPGNILMSGELDRIKITDFGLARVVDDASQSQSGMILGTPQYMSPEQARGESVDQRSDLFSLGSVMYAMCCGHSPFRAETTFGVLRRISDDEPRNVRQHNPSVPAEFAGIIHRLLSKKPQDRFQSATELAELLQSYLAYAQQPTGTRLTSNARRELKSLARRCNGPGNRLLPAMNGNYRRLLLIGFGCLAIITAFTINSWLSDRGSARSTGLESVPTQTQIAQPELTVPSPRVSPQFLGATSLSPKEWDNEYQAALRELNQLERHSQLPPSSGVGALQPLIDEIHTSLENIETQGPQERPSVR